MSARPVQTAESGEFLTLNNIWDFQILVWLKIQRARCFVPLLQMKRRETHDARGNAFIQQLFWNYWKWRHTSSDKVLHCKITTGNRICSSEYIFWCFLRSFWFICFLKNVPETEILARSCRNLTVFLSHSSSGATGRLSEGLISTDRGGNKRMGSKQPVVWFIQEGLQTKLASW